jgi:hypothetical protein
MANAQASHPDRHGPSSLRPVHLVAIVAVAVAAVVAARFVNGAVPVIFAALVAALVPKQHGWSVRGPLAVMAGLFALFLVRMWPESAEVVEAATVSRWEGHHLLGALVGLPIASAIAILFLPRQSHDVLRVTTFSSMLATFALSLPLLGTRMGRGYHFNEDARGCRDSASTITSRSTASRSGW